ncbi:MAG: hypothetical protein COA50_14280 [Flavobacteriaceae bacterium]|nr:MAG: hypothetical protein COA50_14280 [Flavobacteriaceae bacterium]
MKAPNMFYGRGLISFLLTVFRIVFFLSVFATSILLITNMVSMFTNVPLSPPNFPVLFSLTNEGVFNSSSVIEESSFVFNEGMGYVSIVNPSKGMVVFRVILTMLGAVCMLVSLRQTILILEAVKEARFLIIKNALRLRWIALLGIAMFFFDKLSTLVSYAYFSDKLELSGVAFKKFNYFILLNIEFIFYCLFLLVIAEAFRVGAQLQEETKLTI